LCDRPNIRNYGIAAQVYAALENASQNAEFRVARLVPLVVP
jgi:hypothetical protein